MASTADRCDEYPEFVFTRGEAWLYQQAERLRPDLFARIRKLDRARPVARHRRPVHPARPEPADRRRPPPPDRCTASATSATASASRRPSATTSTASATPRACPTSSPSHGYTGYVFRRPEQHQVALPANTFVWQGVKRRRGRRLPHRRPATSPTSPTSTGRSRSRSKTPTRRSATRCASTASATTAAARRRR